MKKILKFFTHKNNKKGFTLVELIITLAVFAILTGMVGGILVPIMRSSNQGTQALKANQISDMFDVAFKVEKLSTRDEVTIAASDNSNFDNALYFENGRLIIRKNAVNVDGQQYYDESTYNGIDFSMQVERVGNDRILRVTITATRNNADIGSYIYTMPMRNMELYDNSIGGLASGTVILYNDIVD